MKFSRRCIAALIAASCIAPSAAADRVIVYPYQNPTSTQQSLVQRFPRVNEGNFFRDAFGLNNGAGAYNGMSIVPNGTLYVDVAPAAANNNGTLYQLAQNDANPVPVNTTPQLAADPTVLMIEGQLSAASSSIGPLSVPGTTGQSQYTLIEAQIQSADINPTQVLFINSAGGKYFQTVNTDRTDAIVFQAKSGTASTTPTVPTVDAGWVPIGTVLVPYGTTTINSGMISMLTPFSGFTTVETFSSLALAATGTINLYPTSARYVLYTSAATGNFTLNVASSPVATLASSMAIGTGISVYFLNTNGSTPYYCTGVTIDGTSTGVTTIWSGGSAPASGNANTVDMYQLKIYKTASATYTVLASQSKY